MKPYRDRVLDEMRAAFNEGRKCAQEGKKPTDNPHDDYYKGTAFAAGYHHETGDLNPTMLSQVHLVSMRDLLAGS